MTVENLKAEKRLPLITCLLVYDGYIRSTAFVWRGSYLGPEKWMFQSHETKHGGDLWMQLKAKWQASMIEGPNNTWNSAAVAFSVIFPSIKFFIFFIFCFYSKQLLFTSHNCGKFCTGWICWCAPDWSPSVTVTASMWTAKPTMESLSTLAQKQQYPWPYIHTCKLPCGSCLQGPLKWMQHRPAWCLDLKIKKRHKLSVNLVTFLSPCRFFTNVLICLKAGGGTATHATC